MLWLILLLRFRVVQTVVGGAVIWLAICIAMAAIRR